MTSLAEVYHGARNESLRRLYLGTGMFVAGALFAVIAIVVASTGVLRPYGFGVYEAREIAGILAGLGVPAVFLGIFTVLPASERERAVAGVGAAIALLGVVLFWSTYPERWITATQDHLTLPVTALYFVGVLTTFWSLFTAVVNFKTRNDPGGTITLERSINGETQLLEVPVAELDGTSLAEVGGLGGVGVVGNVDRESVASGGPEAGDDGIVVRSNGPQAGGGSTPASDGGTQPEAPTTTGSADRRPAAPSTPDRYCGNCGHFDYVNVEGEIEPYCGYHDELMDDMEACEVWRPNAGR